MLLIEMDCMSSYRVVLYVKETSIQPMKMAIESRRRKDSVNIPIPNPYSIELRYVHLRRIGAKSIA
jgi:hypothetical protein